MKTQEELIKEAKLEALKRAAQSFHEDAFYSNSAESGRVGNLIEEYIERNKDNL